MNSSRWIGHALSALAGGAVVWILGSHDEPDVEAFMQRAVPEQRQTQRNAFQSNQSPEVRAQVEELEFALSEAREENARLIAALRTAESKLAEPVPLRNGFFGSPILPGGYDWRDGIDGAIEVFESESRDDPWAADFERELQRSINLQAADMSLFLASQKIECRTYVCRVSFTHGSLPRNWEELEALAVSVTTIARRLVSESSELTGIRLKNSGGYPNEPATSELLLFRTRTGVTNVYPDRLDTPFEK